MNLLNINEQRKYSLEEIQKYRTLYDRIVKVNNEVNAFRKTGFCNHGQRSNLSANAWKAVREYETQVPQDIQQVLNFDTAEFSGRMEDIFKQQII